MVFLGIDVGKKGAIAVLDGSDIRIHPVPLIRASKGKGRDEYDLVGIRDLLCEYSAEDLFVTVEKSQPMPPTVRGGVQASFHRGVGRGWEWMLVALRIPYQLVAPRTWQKVMHAGTPGNDTKQRSVLAAQRLFPSVDLRRSEKSRKPDHGFADALLLADFGRRVRGIPE